MRPLLRALSAVLAMALALANTASGQPAQGTPPEDGCAPHGSAPCNLRELRNGGLAADAAAPTALLPDLPAVTQNPRLGVNFANYPDNYPGSYAQAKTAGASYDRVTFSMVGTAGGWGGYDSLISAATSQGVEILGTLVEPAANACDTSISYGIWCVPKGLNLAWDDPGFPWGSWVYQVVNRYKSRIRAWEVWNEPNLEFWSGSNAQYAQLLKRTYQAIKAADPTATVVFGGIYRGNNIDRTVGFWSALANDAEGPANNYFFDVMGYHLYDGGHCSTFDEIAYMRWTMMPVALQAKPWWITESGIRVLDPAPDGFVTPYQQASWVISNYAYALYHDIKRFYLWRMTDGGDTVQPWGLLTDAGAARPAYTAFQVAAQYLPATFNWSVRRFAESAPNQTANRITFYGTPLGRVSVFYNVGANPQTLTATAVLTTGTYVYQDGTTASAPAVNGQRIFNLPAAPKFNIPWSPADCLAPSPPIILIERDTRAPTASLTALPPVSGGAVISLSWSGADLENAGDQGVAQVWYYDGQVRTGQGPWTTLFQAETYTRTTYTGILSETYSFRVRAVDWAGNIQDWAAANIVTTQLSASAASVRSFLPTMVR